MHACTRPLIPACYRTPGPPCLQNRHGARGCTNRQSRTPREPARRCNFCGQDPTTCVIITWSRTVNHDATTRRVFVMLPTPRRKRQRATHAWPCAHSAAFLKCITGLEHLAVLAVCAVAYPYTDCLPATSHQRLGGGWRGQQRTLWRLDDDGLIVIQDLMP